MIDTQELDLPTGLKGHRRMAEEIASWCPDWISERVFDELEREARWPNKPRRIHAMSMSGDDFILSFDRPYLHLAQLMAECGLIETKEVDGLVWYRLTPSIRRERTAE